MTSLCWSSADDARAVQEFHAPLFRRWKKRHGVTGPYGLDTVDGFRESLQRLHDYGYSLTDIGAMWGVTRERVRQWFEKMGLERYDDHASVRVWDDDLALFLPVTKEEYAEREAAARRANRDHAALMADIEMVQTVAAKLGRVPIIADLAEHVFGHRHYPLDRMASRWGYGTDTDYPGALARLYEAAGLEKPGRGEGQRRRSDRNMYTREEVVDQLRAISNGKPAGRMELCRALDRYENDSSTYIVVAKLFGKSEGVSYAEAWDRLYAEAFPHLFDAKEES